MSGWPSLVPDSDEEVEGNWDSEIQEFGGFLSTCLKVFLRFDRYVKRMTYNR